MVTKHDENLVLPHPLSTTVRKSIKRLKEISAAKHAPMHVERLVRSVARQSAEASVAFVNQVGTQLEDQLGLDLDAAYFSNQL